jgi:hypothetical protein
MLRILRKVGAGRIPAVKNADNISYTVSFTPSDEFGDPASLPITFSVSPADLVQGLTDLDAAFARETAEYDKKRAAIVSAMAVIT